MDWKYARIAFVCTGNICRSPMAEALCRMKLERVGGQPLVISMSTLGLTGRSAHPHAVSAIEEIGGDLSGHRSQPLNGALLERCDAAFGMESMHVDAMLKMGNHARMISKLMSDYAEMTLNEISDPVRGNLDDFRACRDLLSQCIDKWLKMIVL